MRRWAANRWAHSGRWSRRQASLPSQSVGLCAARGRRGRLWGWVSSGRLGCRHLCAGRWRHQGRRCRGGLWGRRGGYGGTGAGKRGGRFLHSNSNRKGRAAEPAYTVGCSLDGKQFRHAHAKVGREQRAKFVVSVQGGRLEWRSVAHHALRFGEQQPHLLRARSESPPLEDYLQLSR